MPASGLIQELVHGHGLNHRLALFYLLTFVRQARAEITLTANHDVTLSSNRRFKGDRLSAGLVESIAFSSALIGSFETVTLEPSPTWESALPYVRALDSALEADALVSSEIQEPRQLLRRVLQLREKIQKTRLALEGFRTIFPGSATVADKTLSDLEALTASAGYGSDYIGFYNTAEDRFGDAANLTNAVEAFKRAKRLGMLVEVISRAKTYLDKIR